MFPKILALSLAVGCLSVRAAELIPIEDFARPAKFSDIELAPDGEWIGYIREFEGVDRMCFSEVATMKMLALDLGQGKNLPFDRGIFAFDWIGPMRLVLRTSLDFYPGGWVAVDRDRKNVQPLSGDIAEGRGLELEASGFYPRSILYKFDDGRTILVTNPRYDLGGHESQFPEIIKLDTRTGIGSTYLKNPGNVVRWCADRKGQIRVGIASADGRESIIYRDTPDEAWRTVANFEEDLEVTPISFTSDGNYIFASAITSEGTEGLYKYDPRKGELGELIWSDPTYDVDGFVREPGTRKLIGVRYIAEGFRTKWLDEKYVALQDAVDATLPDRINVLTSFSKDAKKMLVSSYSDRQPRIAYLYDIEKHELRELGKSRGWIDPEMMANIHPVTYEARDGVLIHGFLTVPVGKQPRNLPLVVMPHGGPWTRDEWEFDPLVQMLANRGYAVLQMNYRGSTGYGTKFYRLGRLEVGGKIEEDVEDATRWAIAKKIANPKRIAILGASYGGYSALFALGKSPDLYCCGVSISGVTDWLGIYKEIDPELDIARDHWRRLFGDPDKEEEKLKAISPVYFADKIKAPVLIIQGLRDWIVPSRQAKKMISALEKAGQKPETLLIPDEAHHIKHEKARIAEFKAIEAFLAKHLGSGVAASTVPTVAVEPASKNK